jgi:hypothetical protein
MLILIKYFIDYRHINLIELYNKFTGIFIALFYQTGYIGRVGLYICFHVSSLKILDEFRCTLLRDVEPT